MKSELLGPWNETKCATGRAGRTIPERVRATNMDTTLSLESINETVRQVVKLLNMHPTVDLQWKKPYEL